MKKVTEYRIRINGFNKRIYSFHKSRHSYSDVDEIRILHWFLWWRLEISIVGKGILKPR